MTKFVRFQAARISPELPRQEYAGDSQRMKILVTGATGFTGGWVLKTLGEKFGATRVWGTGRNPDRARLLREQGYQLITGDLTDAGFVQEKLQRFTHIVHCAALSSPFGAYHAFYANNVQSTRNLLNGIGSVQKIVHISTPSLYFNFADRFNVRENDPLPKRFVNHYTATKYLAEQAVLQHPERQAIVLRPRAIVGAGDTVIMPRLLRAYETGRLKIIGDGRNICDFTSVRNLAHAVCLALDAGPEANGKIFNITDGEPRPLWPLIGHTLGKLGFDTELSSIPYPVVYAVAAAGEFYSLLVSKKEPVLTRYGIGVLKYSLTMDISAARHILRYTPVITTEQSIDEFVKYYKGEISV